ncbi:CHS-3 chitin synthase 3 [Fusarium coicis]|nr:CHS-3 chitin synthase 3 [Fusarium coicis]
MFASDRAPLVPQFPDFAEHPEYGTELQPIARHDPVPVADNVSESRIHVPIPSDLADAAGLDVNSTEEQSIHEMSHLTYTAISTDPQQFYEKYNLRPKQLKFPRHTEILVGITVYNEPKHLLRRTLLSVVQNIWYLNIRTQSKVWGKRSWTKIVVCIPIDGLESVDPGVLDVLTTIGLYQNGLCKKTTDQGEEVTGHLFEFSSHLTTHLGCEDYPDGEVDAPRLVKNHPNSERSMRFPVQLMLLMKASNCGKLNSYRWLYNGFAKVLDPNITVHLDVGTKLGKQALYKLWREFDLEPMLAAACGEISCSLGGNWLNILNPIVTAQNFEYKVGFQLDRTFESATGFLSLLPGACSAYRYVGSAGKPLEDMLLGDPTWIQTGEQLRPSMSPVNLNRHLADDRVICFRIISKPKTRWLLKYVPVTATTDIPMTTTDFINQRRRWLNGAFFSTIYVLKRCGHLWRSDHSRIRKLAFFIPLLHSVLALVLAWFSLAAFLLTTFTINSISGDPPKDAPAGGFPFGKATPIVNAVIQIVYLATVLFQFILALGSRPRNHRISYIISFAIFGLIQAYLIMNLIYLVKRVTDYKADDTGSSNYAYIGEFYADIGQSTIIVAGFSVFGVYILSALLALDPWHLLTSFAQFLFISSSYVNILNIYAFSNTHDVSWGRKGRHQDTEEGQRQEGPRPATIERRFTFSDQDPNIRSAATQRDETPQARNREYQEALARATAEDETVSRERKRPRVLAIADAMMEFRTILLASYIFSNIFVCLIVLNDSLKILWWLGDSYWHKVWFFRIWLWANSISFLIRIRRVKCDEKKPACHRCTSTGRKCDGYALMQKINPRDVAQGRMLLPRVATINSQSLLPVEERRALGYFHSVISPRLSSARDGYFWTHLVMQLSESESVVKHTILSISSLFESSEGKSVAPYTERFALQHYTQAIQRLKTIHSEPLVLLVCILFICVEYLLANNKIALQHCQHGLAIMEKCSDPWARRYLMPVFRRMTAVPMLFGPEDIESESMPALTYMIPTKFYCMEDAQYMMDDIFNRVVRLCHMRHRGVVFDMTEEYNTVGTHLLTWQTLFEKLNVDTTSLLYQAQERSLFMRLKLSYLELSADFRYQEHMGTFRQVLQLASWQSESNMPKLNISFPRPVKPDKVRRSRWHLKSNTRSERLFNITFIPECVSFVLTHYQVILSSNSPQVTLFDMKFLSVTFLAMISGALALPVAAPDNGHVGYEGLEPPPKAANQADNGYTRGCNPYFQCPGGK